jgi:ubiquinone/menaquinone biosynthesis C-methylase UbiE
MALDHNDIVDFNIRAHDEIASKYDENHVEIFNPTEQHRVRQVLQQAYQCLQQAPHEKNVAMDFGAGTGNLTQYLLELGASVIAADVSPKCLDVVKTRYGNHAGLSTFVLNGHDLREIEDNSIDMLATYSVLHHVPDYLKIVGEFVRVVKPGGVIYIDHEVDETYWEHDAAYMAYLKELGDSFYNEHAAEIGMAPTTRPTGFARALLNKLRRAFSAPPPVVLSGFGDIHVFRHDHIEWGRIEAILRNKCTIEAQSTYLVCRETDAAAPAWTRWNSRCFDMRYLIARKNSNDAL